MEAWLAAIVAVIALVVVTTLAARDRRAIGAIRSAVGIRSDGDPVVAVRDLAARAEQLEAGRARDAQDRDAFVDALSQGVLTIDDGPRIVGANAAAHVLLDRAPGALLGQTLMEAFIDTQVEAVANAALEVGSATGEVAVAGADGPKLVLRARRAPGGGLWIVMEDVSELRRLQQIRAEFIDNLSHELRTPLTTVSLLAETLNREAEAAGDSVPARMRDRIGKIEIETSHLVQMVNELLDLSRIESGGALGVVDLLDLGQVATESVERLRLFADRQGVTFVVDVPAAVPAVQGDEQRLGQVLVNLLHNAVKFSPDGGEVRVSVVASGPDVVVAIADHGVGIPRAAQARIFERFYKVDRARARGAVGGTGLGLAIARHIIEQHGGRIWVEIGRGVGEYVLVLVAHRRRGRLKHPSKESMDRLHVATLNIRNLADRWFERLPLLLADMAALQPDFLGLQEVVYPMQQDRLIGSAGEGHYGAVRGWAGRPEYGNSLIVREPLIATDVQRVDLGHNRSAHRARIALPGGSTVLAAVTHLHHLGPDETIRDQQTAALLTWLDEAPAADVTILMGDFNADPAEPSPARLRAAGFRSAFAEANGTEPAVTWPSGLTAPAMDMDGEPECLDYIWLRGSVRTTSARLVFDRPDPEDPTIYPSDHFGIAAQLEIGEG